MGSQSRWLSLFVAALAGLSGCEGEDADAKSKTQTESKTTYSCEITVAAVPGEPESYKGQAQTTSEAEAEKQAWDAVCVKLPEADRGDCRDNDKWKYAKGTMSGELAGGATHSVTITLTRAVKPVEHSSGSIESESSEEEACKEALAKACEAAGAPGDCLAAGTHEERGRAAGKTTYSG